MTKKMSIEDSNSKRIGICKICGYEWGARNSNLSKPPICPSCHSRKGTAWKDELTDEEILEIQGLTKQNKSTEGTAEKDGSTSLTREKRTPSTKTTPDNGETKGIVMLNSNGDVQNVIPAETVKAIINANNGNFKDITAKSISKATDNEGSGDDEATEEPQEVYVPEIGLTVPLIDEPEIDDTEKPLSYVAWKTKDGDTEYGAVVDVETAECLSDYLDEKEGVVDPVEPTVKDLDVLAEAGLLDNDDTSDYALFKSTNSPGYEEDESEVPDEYEKTATSKNEKSKQNGGAVGVTFGGVLLIAGVCAAVAVPLVKVLSQEVKTGSKQSTKEEKEDNRLKAEPNDRHYTSNYLNNLYNAENNSQSLNSTTHSTAFAALRTVPEGSI